MRTPHGVPHGATARNDQELAWAGEHGNDYNRRSPGNEDANYQLFRKIFGRHTPAGASYLFPQTVLELGAGTGANVRAIARLFPDAQITAVELNQHACEALQKTTGARVVNASVLDWRPPHRFDVVLTKGLLIHIPPDELKRVYHLIHEAAGRWIVLAEYYNPTRVGIPYRGQDNLLWKADFAGEMLDLFPDLRVVDHGFAWRRDEHPQDDITWFLLEKVVQPVRAADAVGAL